MKINTATLSNGIRILHVQERGEVSYCGSIIACGTRDELPDEHGMAHLMEHMLFKGTAKRSATSIIDRLEGVGGELNAFTTKENITVYGISLKKHFERAYELVADMVFNSQFTDDELDKERMVVMDEIDLYLDDPSDQISDDFEDLVFAGYPLGRGILGTKKGLKTYTGESLKRFVNRCFTPDRILFFSMGSASFERVMGMAEQYLGSVPVASGCLSDRQTPVLYTPTVTTIHKHTKQMHCQLGGRAYPKQHPNYSAMHLANYLLGGASSSSRLNMELREKQGLVYTVDSTYASYADTGVWSVYFGADKHDKDRILDTILSEITHIQTQPLSAVALRRLKDQFLSRLVIAGESRESWLLSTARKFMVSGKVSSKRETVQRIGEVTSEQICAVSQEVMNPEQFCYLFYD